MLILFNNVDIYFNKLKFKVKKSKNVTKLNDKVH